MGAAAQPVSKIRPAVPPRPSSVSIHQSLNRELPHRAGPLLTVNAQGSIYAGILYQQVTGSLCLSQASLGIKAGYTLDRVPTHRRAHTHTHSHSLTQYRQFRDANQPITHVFGLEEETGVNPRGTGRTCKLHTHMAEAGIESPTLEV
ncbi:hypothetical protein QTP70_018241 [Hemibagrus guttatus]|uniref:Uncharacterized protein n=1 Tax=Hemibagrus guttatus TaxID=175788 RepID=A0AAE0Q6N7_9TELE|nr:hypothetical protein QTP70_018241 [Hemibagrus guttatus]